MFGWKLAALAIVVVVLAFGPSRARADVTYEFWPQTLTGALAAVDYHPIFTVTDAAYQRGTLKFDVACSFSSPSYCSTFTGDTGDLVVCTDCSLGFGNFSVDLVLADLMTGTRDEDGLNQNWHGTSDLAGLWNFTLFSDRYSGCGTNSPCTGTGTWTRDPIPEPSSLALLGFSLLLFIGLHITRGRSVELEPA